MAKDTMFMEELTDQELEQVNGGCYSSCGYYGGYYGGSYGGSSSSYYGGSYSGGGYYYDYAAVGYGYSC